MEEVSQVISAVRECVAEDMHILFGAIYDEKMGEDIRVTIVAVGLDCPVRHQQV